MSTSLVKKYNVAGPRYTSYPPVPFWHNCPDEGQWKASVQQTFRATNHTEGISLYLHLPFCESLCTFCGCNKRITKNHKVEDPYIEAILAEWETYKQWFGDAPVIREIHIGGGTPTFFSPENLDSLFGRLLEGCALHPDRSFSFEAHPNNTTAGHLKVLFDRGFNRLSLGVQDFDPKVQRIVNRVQPYEKVEHVVVEARKLGYTSINFDLIYGLPFQTAKSIELTIGLVNQLRPERIAFYSYAHVPWKSPGQRMFTEKDLPNNDEKRALYELGKAMLEDAGYLEIGMDHFALEEDDLYQAAQSGKLHRNFMGYTTGQTELLVGLGASSISDSWGAFIQNEKKVETYSSAVEAGNIPIINGHILSDSDKILRSHIQNLMTKFETSWDQKEKQHPILETLDSKLAEPIKDGLVILKPQALIITEEGQPFVRNICMALDEYLLKAKTDQPMFSKTV